MAEKLKEKLTQYRIPEKFLKIITIYEDYMTKIKQNGQLLYPITIETGVIQDCILSPMLFQIIIHSAMKNIADGKTGIDWQVFQN